MRNVTSELIEAPPAREDARAMPRTDANDKVPLKSAQPRILMVVESCQGGTGRHVLDLCHGLIARGCDVHLAYSTRRINAMFQQRIALIDGIKSFALPMRTIVHPSDFANVRSLRRYARQYGPFDIIHGHSSKGGALARLTSIGTRAAAFYTIHGLIMLDPDLARWKRFVYLWIERGLSKRTARIIAVAPEEQRAAIALGLGERRVILVPNGIDQTQNSPRTAARRELEMDEGAVVVGFVGRLVSQKAPHILLEAFARARREAPVLKLVMIGSGPLEADMHALADRLGVAGQIVWTGERDARELMSSFDIFAIPSRKEGLPYVVIEAMDAGIPIVATSTAGVEILVEQGANGYVVSRDDSTAMAQALIELANNAALRRQFGQASRARAARFTVEAMVDQTLAAYQAAIA